LLNASIYKSSNVSMCVCVCVLCNKVIWKKEIQLSPDTYYLLTHSLIRTINMEMVQLKSIVVL